MQGTFIVLILGQLLAAMVLLIELGHSKLTTTPSGRQTHRTDRRLCISNRVIDEPQLLTSCHLVSVRCNGNNLR
jgi:hypothetical protein